MGIQETAQEVKGLVDALAEGKQLEYRSKRVTGATWCVYNPQADVISFNVDYYEYRIKRDLREELFDLVKKYGLEMFRVGKAHEAECRNEEKELRKNAEEIGARIELLVDMMLRGEK